MIDRRFLNLGFTVAAVANSPTETPVEGVQYIVGSEAAGDFAGVSAGYIARYTNGGWEFIAPRAGALEVLNTSTGDILRYNGAAWATIVNLAKFN